jgi:hypothetical protein
MPIMEGPKAKVNEDGEDIHGPERNMLFQITQTGGPNISELVDFNEDFLLAGEIGYGFPASNF